MESEDYLLISGIQHYKFCPRQWALIHIEQQWVENHLTAIGRLQHERADSGKREKRGNIITTRSMPVVSQHLKIQGVCDVVEFVKDDTGINITGLDGKYIVYPIEYKKGKQKKDTEDILQLTAQAMCLEEMLCTDIPYGYMFYKETKKRVKVDFSHDLREEVKACVLQMNEYFLRQHTPKAKKKPVCKSCSLSDICLPSLEKATDVKKYLQGAFE